MVDRREPGIMAYAGIGMLNALCLLVSLALGWYLDITFGTTPLFMMLGLIVGITLGVLATRAELRRRS